jgi:hypothetical protein
MVSPVRRAETWPVAVGHGNRGRQLAIRIIEQINAWDRGWTADPHLFAYPVGTPVPPGIPGKFIVKPGILLFLCYEAGEVRINPEHEKNARRGRHASR